MEKWQWTALILCGFGLFKEFRPSESFFTEYILHYYDDVTSEILVHDAYPVSTYSYLGTLAIVFLVTDFLRYRSVIILEGAAYVTTWCILTWGHNLTALYCVEVLYGLACSTEVAYYTYIYAKVDRDKFKKVTSYTYSAILTGRFFAGLLSQILVQGAGMNYHDLNYISLTCVSIAFTLSLFLPGVHQSIYFHRGDQDQNDNTVGNKLSIAERIRRAYPILWSDFKTAFTNPYVIKWSIWWAVASAGHLQVINYIQAMWETISSYKDGAIYNGAVEATHTLLSAVLAFGVGHVNINWGRWGESFLCVTSVLAGVMLILISLTKDIIVAYVCYVLFRTIFQVTITVASAEVAQMISEDSSGLIFGVNTFVALTLQTILTVVVADSKGFKLKESDQFFVYGFCYAILGGVFLVIAACTFGRYGSKGAPKISQFDNVANLKNPDPEISNGVTQEPRSYQETETDEIFEIQNSSSPLTDFKDEK